MSNVLHVPLNEIVPSASSDCSRQERILQCVQRSLKWMMDLLPKVCKARELELDTYTGTFVPAELCL